MDPDVRAIVSSGYSNDPIMAHPQDHGFKDVLQKPFTMMDLSVKISAVLAPRSGIIRRTGMTSSTFEEEVQHQT
jgi:hypothetical protein